MQSPKFVLLLKLTTKLILPFYSTLFQRHIRVSSYLLFNGLILTYRMIFFSFYFSHEIFSNKYVVTSKFIFSLYHYLCILKIAINQMVNVLPQHVRDGINDAAALFGMPRNDFLLRCLKELQAFEKYSKIDFVNGLQRIVKFIDEQLTREQQKELEKLEEKGIQVARLIFSNKLQSGHLNGVYDIMAKIYRKQIDPETFVNVLPQIVDDILLQALLNGVVVG